MENLLNNNNDEKILETDYIPFPFENSKNNSNNSSKIRKKIETELLRNSSNKEIKRKFRTKKSIFSNKFLRDSIYNSNRQFNNFLKDEATKLKLKMSIIQNKELHKQPFNDLIIIQSENKNNKNKKERKKRKILSIKETRKNDLQDSIKIISSSSNNMINKRHKTIAKKKFVSTEQQTIMKIGYVNDSYRVYSKSNNINNIDAFQNKNEDNVIGQETNNNIINSINYGNNNIINNDNTTINNKNTEIKDYKFDNSSNNGRVSNNLKINKNLNLKEKTKNNTITSIFNKKNEYMNKIRKKLNFDINNNLGLKNILNKIDYEKYNNYKTIQQNQQNNDYPQLDNNTKSLFSDMKKKNKNKIINLGEASMKSTDENLTSIRELHRRLISTQEKQKKNLIKRNNSGLYTGKDVKLFLNKKLNEKKRKKSIKSSLVALEEFKQKNKNNTIMNFKQLYETKGESLSAIEWTGSSNRITGKNLKKGRKALLSNLSGDFNIDFACNRFYFKNYMESVKKKGKVFSDIFNNLPDNIQYKKKIFIMRNNQNIKISNNLENNTNNINKGNRTRDMKIKHLAKIKEINFC